MYKFLAKIETPEGYGTIEKSLYIAFLIGIGNVVSGIVLFFAPDAIHATSLSTLTHVDTHIVPVSLVCIGFLAIYATLYRDMTLLSRLLCITPQQIMLFFQAWAILVAIFHGAYPDGYVPKGGPWFILADQIWAWLFSIAHSFEYIALYIVARRRDFP